MEVLEDIFVPYEIAVQLKEIGFDEPCIAYYYDDKDLHLFEKDFKITTDEEYNHFVSAPTYEQVKKWFRGKGLTGAVVPRVSDSDFYYVIRIDYRTYPSDDYPTFQQAREQLIYKLIEIYKDGK